MTVKIEKAGRRIEIRSTRPVTGLKTAIPGAYESVNGHWTVPLSFESCRLLRAKYGRSLEVGPRLRQWAKGVRRNRDYMARLAGSKKARLDVVPREAPKLYKAMRRRKYQPVGARFIADSHACLEADEPGLGKTLIAMAGIIESETPGPYLVIAPKTAAESVWKREIERWLSKDHQAVTVPETRLMRERVLKYTSMGPKTWVIVHPEMVMVSTVLLCDRCGKKSPLGTRGQRILKNCKHERDRKTKKIDEPSYKRLFDVEWGAIIIDESHESLIRRSGVPTQRRNGMDKLKIRPDGLKIAMSGTPFDNKPHQLWGTLNWLDPKTYSAFHRWAALYWEKGGYTGFEIGEFKKEREDMLWDSLSSVAIRRTKLEVAPDLPPKMEIGYPLDPSDEDSPNGIWLDMDPKQAKAYEQMEKNSFADLDSGRLDAVTALAELTRLKQFASSYGRVEVKKIRVRCGESEVEHCRSCQRRGYHIEERDKFYPELPSNKFNWLVNSLEEWGYPRTPLTKVVVVSWQTGLLDVVASNLERHFKTKPNRPLTTAITGKTKNREEVRQRFNEADWPLVMMLNVKAGGTAITIDSADRMVFIGETRIPDKETQAEDRIHRVSNPRQCMYYYLRSLNTVDVGTAIIRKELIGQSHRLLDARRGVEYFRQVVDYRRGRN